MGEHDGYRHKLSALSKSMLVLEAVAAQPQAVGLPDLTAKLNMPRQTLHRVLQQLEELELVVREPGRDRYAVGPALTRLGLNALMSDNQGAPVRVALRSLADDINETCNLGILRGREFVYLERAECAWSLKVDIPTGAPVPAHCTAGGKLLLAFLPDHLRSKIIEIAPLERFTEQTITDPDELEAELAAIRERGFSVNVEEYSVGTLGVATPITGADGVVVAALAMHAPTARVSTEEVGELVSKLDATADAIAAGWGASSLS